MLNHYGYEAYADFFTVPDDPPPKTRGGLQNIPTIVVEEAQDIPMIVIGDAIPKGRQHLLMLVMMIIRHESWISLCC